MSRPATLLFSAAIFCAWPLSVLAHPAEQALVLLLPTELYNLGGTLTVAISIVLIGLVPAWAVARAFGTLRLGPGRDHAGLEQVTSLASLAVFLAVIAIGILGPNDPQANLLPLMFWTGFWVILFLIQGLVFDLWRWVNPWAGVGRLLSGGGGLVEMPARWRHWPAVLGFVGFQYFLLADIAPNDPDRLALILLGYSAVTFAGMAAFGAEAWLARAECFTVLFRLIGALRPLARRDGLRLGLPGWAALGKAPLDLSLSVFCLMILISGSFDGLRETFWWLGLIGINPLEFPGRSAVLWSSLLGLVGANVLAIGVYAGAIYLGVALVRWRGGEADFAHSFNTLAIAILPIAFGYHFAHYFVSLLVQSQYLAVTLGDPLLRGWDIAGLAGTRVTTGFLNSMETVRPILLTNVFVVVGAHLASVVLSHVLAHRCTTGARNLVLLQLGLGAVMIFYTFFGLWLLSTPRGA